MRYEGHWSTGEPSRTPRAGGGGKIGHRTLVLASLLVAAIAGCVSDDQGPGLAPPAWQDGESAGYEILRNDSAIYRVRVRLVFSEELPAVRAAGEPVPTVLVTSTAEPGEGGEYFYDSLTVVLRRDSLMPLRSYRSIETGISELEVAARFEPGRVTISKTTVDGVQEEGLRLPRGCYSQDVLGTVLRAVPLAPGTSFRTNLVVPVDFRVVPVKVQVLGTKLVGTGLGDILCREVAVSSPGRETRFWVELAEPRRLVGLRDLQSRTEMRLVSYEAGQGRLDIGP